MAASFSLASGSASAQSGRASWYGPAGRTACGGRPIGFTAAHRTLPCGTLIEVTHNLTGKSVLVRVNDRGPFIRGRIVDLSKTAANALGMVRSGTATVSLRVMDGR